MVCQLPFYCKMFWLIRAAGATCWWLAERHLSGCFAFLSQFLGKVVGPTNNILSVFECSLSSQVNLSRQS